MKAVSILLVVLAVVLIAGAGVGGYYYGVSAGKTQANNVRTQFLAQRTGGQGAGQPGGTPGAGFSFSGTPGAGGFGGQGGAGRGGTTGTIKAIQGNTITLSAPDREMQVAVGDNTRITTSTSVKVTDLKVGERIMVGGQTNGDTVTASTITVIPDIPQ